MSGGNGNEFGVAQMAGGLRGGEQAAADSMRATEGGWPLAGPAQVGANPQYPPQVQTAAPVVTSQNPIGFSITLTREQVEQAIKARAMKFARSKGVVVPSDETDFQFRAKVRWTGDGGAAVTLEV